MSVPSSKVLEEPSSDILQNTRTFSRKQIDFSGRRMKGRPERCDAQMEHLVERGNVGINCHCAWWV